MRWKIRIALCQAAPQFFSRYLKVTQLHLRSQLPRALTEILSFASSPKPVLEHYVDTNS